MKRIVTLFLFGLMTAFASSQPADTTAAGNAIQVKVGGFYNSAVHYYGRRDSLESSAFFGLAECRIGGHFYMNAAPVFLNNAVASFQYTGTILTAGYIMKSKNESWLYHLYVLKPFYKKTTTIVESVLKAQAGVSLTYTGDIVNIMAGADARISDRVEAGVNGEIDHPFRWDWDRGLSLSIDPTASVAAGTQRFIQAYYKERKILFLPAAGETFTRDINRFTVLNYEVSLPVIFSLGRIEFIFIPARIMPRHLIQSPEGTETDEGVASVISLTAGCKFSL